MSIRPTIDLFVKPPTDDPNEALIPLSLVSAEDGIAVGTLPEGVERLADDAQVTVYFQHQREFYKQAAVVAPAEVDDEPAVLRFGLLGDAMSAEQRQAYRVSCVGCTIEVTMGHEAGCQVVDISSTGFGVYATQALRIGELLDVALHHGGETFRGQAAVQSVRPMGSHTRYGVAAVDSPAGHALTKALPRVNAAIQREQLRRLS